MQLKTGERILAIDFGEKRIGIAVTDPLRMFAQPLITLENNENFWQRFLKILSDYEVKLIILGYPLKESGEKTHATEKVEKFFTELTAKTNIEVLYRDERYSSGIAQQRIIETVKSKMKRRDKSLIDKNAAAVILEDYLNEKG